MTIPGTSGTVLQRNGYLCGTGTQRKNPGCPGRFRDSWQLWCVCVGVCVSVGVCGCGGGGGGGGGVGVCVDVVGMRCVCVCVSVSHYLSSIPVRTYHLFAHVMCVSVRLFCVLCFCYENFFGVRMSMYRGTRR